MKRSIGIWLAAAGAAIGLLVITLLAPDRGSAREIPPKTAGTSNPSIPATPAASASSTSVAVGERDPVGDKDRLMEEALADQRAASTDELAGIDLDEPRPAPAPGERVAESRVERTLSASEKAHQTQRVVHALADRARRVRQRLEAARRSGDQDEVRRQEVIHQRLTRRVATLTERAESLSQQADQESALDREETHGGHADPHDHGSVEGAVESGEPSG